MSAKKQKVGEAKLKSWGKELGNLHVALRTGKGDGRAGG